MRAKPFLLLFLGIFGFGCATSSVALKSEASRKIASITSRFDLECLAETGVFQQTHGEDANLGLDLETGDFDSTLDPRYSTLSPEEKTKALALALAEAFAYGQKLLGEYELLLERGYSISQVMRKSSVYAELQALYFLKHDLQRLTNRELAKAVLERLENEEESGRPRGVAVIEKESLRQLERLRAFISERTSDPRLATLALAEVERGLGDLRITANSCGRYPLAPASSFAGFTLSLTQKVLGQARGFPKSGETYRLFAAKTGEFGIPVSEVVRFQAKSIRKNWDASQERSPQNTVAEKIFYPSPGRPGNITGLNFPKGVWALTFDDGPHGGTASVPSHTKEVLANLAKHEMKATFFVVSQQITRDDCPNIEPRIRVARPSKTFPELALAERDAGHAVASHSYYHSQVPKDSAAEQECEITGATSAFAKILGSEPQFYRLPYGAGVSIPTIRTQIATAGLIHVFWSVDTLDWQDHDPDSIVRRTLMAMANGGRGVILFHDVHPQSVIASEQIMSHLKDPANALEAVTLPQIVDRMNGEEVASEPAAPAP